jgi:hypothetical protein
VKAILSGKERMECRCGIVGRDRTTSSHTYSYSVRSTTLHSSRATRHRKVRSSELHMARAISRQSCRCLWFPCLFLNASVKTLVDSHVQGAEELVSSWDCCQNKESVAVRPQVSSWNCLGHSRKESCMRLAKQDKPPDRIFRWIFAAQC